LLSARHRRRGGQTVGRTAGAGDSVQGPQKGRGDIAQDGAVRMLIGTDDRVRCFLKVR